jgi:hypothetical protein
MLSRLYVEKLHSECNPFSQSLNFLNNLSTQTCVMICAQTSEGESFTMLYVVKQI